METGQISFDKASNVNVKVLVVVDRFPATGGSRIDKFVKLLPDYGVEPVVLSAEETDSTHAQEIKRRNYPSTLKTYQAKSVGWSYFTERFLMRGRGARHYRLLSLLSFPERCVLVPDYMVRWIPLGLRLASNIVRGEGTRVVLTSSPSESVHLIGLRLKRKFGIRWVADFRDLWTEKELLYRPATPLHDWWVRRLERKVFQLADHIIANTPENAERYIRRFGLSPDRVTVIPNGFDWDDLTDRCVADASAPRTFRIGYSGSLDKHDFPWRIALEALKNLAQDVGRDVAEAQPQIAGRLADSGLLFAPAALTRPSLERLRARIRGDLVTVDRTDIAALSRTMNSQLSPARAAGERLPRRFQPTDMPIRQQD